MGWFLGELLLGILIELCCGFIGHWFVRILTLGKVQLSFSNDEFTIATLIGIFVLIGAAVLLFMYI